ncbi:MAG: hypothetical protein NVSMB9_28900 [Isosphaeraceae bacterium]
MDPSYRKGNTVVLATLVAALGICLATVQLRPPPARAAQNLPEGGWDLGPFHLNERSGRPITDADLADRVWVASFIFTRCPLSCPRISTVMKGLQPRFERTPVKLVSITVDPDHDTPPVLADYARRFDADPERWWFLTGEKPVVLALITGRFKLGLQSNSAADQDAGAEAFAHSDRLALVD